MSPYAWEACLTAFAGDIGAIQILNIGHYCRSKIPPKILLKSTAFSQSQNEALNYVENTMYFETSDLKIHFLMIRNSEITVKYPYSLCSYSGQHQ